MRTSVSVAVLMHSALYGFGYLHGCGRRYGYFYSHGFRATSSWDRTLRPIALSPALTPATINSLGATPDKSDESQHSPELSQVEVPDPSLRLFVFGVQGNVGRVVSQLCQNLNRRGETIAGGLYAKIKDKNRQKSARSEDTFSIFSTISGTVRETTSIKRPTNKNFKHPTIQCISFDEREEVKAALSQATHVLVTIPPQIHLQTHRMISIEDKEETKQNTYHDLVLTMGYDKYIPHSAWVGFVSTTSVYGDHKGGWVNEASDTIATVETDSQGGDKDNARKRLEVNSKSLGYLRVEAQWSQAMQQKKVPIQDDGRLSNSTLCIFRCSGMYGKHSSALHTVCRQSKASQLAARTQTQVQSFNPKKNEKESFTSRIHMEDISRAIVASMLQHVPSTSFTKDTEAPDQEKHGCDLSVSIYNLADDEPAPRSVVMAHARHMLQPYTRSESHIQSHKPHYNASRVVERLAMNRTPDSSRTKNEKKVTERSRRRGLTNKRVDNTKMKNQLLGIWGGLRYPTYREGLAAILSCALYSNEGNDGDELDRAENAFYS